jgi:hypothetical protein
MEGESMEWLVMSTVPFLFFVIWLGIAIYVVTLMTRVTRATERIAASLERNPRGPM